VRRQSTKKAAGRFSGSLYSNLTSDIGVS